MAHLNLEKALGDLPGARKDGTAYLLGEELDVLLYANLGDEVLQIGRVSRIDIVGETATILTHKGERFFVPTLCVIALKAGAAKKPSVGSSAGFRA